MRKKNIFLLILAAVFTLPVFAHSQISGFYYNLNSGLYAPDSGWNF